MYAKLFVLSTDISNHCCVCGAMRLVPGSLMAVSLVVLVMEVEAIRLGSSSVGEVWSHVGLSFLLLADVDMLFACLLKEGYRLLLLLLTLAVVSHSSFVYIKMSCPLQPFVSISFPSIFVFIISFLEWMFPVCCYMHTCFFCWLSRYADTYMKCI